MKLPNKYALLLATNDSEYVKKTYNGYFNVFVNAFGDEGENWDLFRVVQDEFPNMEEIGKYDGFVVSGSPYDAYSNEEWILKLCFLLQTLDAMQKKVLGICFGHQVICRALGGRVGKASKGWDVGMKMVFMIDDLPHCKFIEEMDEIPKGSSILQCHQDEVLEVPFGAQVLAFSDNTAVEVFCIGDHILGIQGHPEYTMDILTNLIDRLLTHDNIDQVIADDAKASLEGAESECEFWKKMCKVFLKGTKSYTLD